MLQPTVQPANYLQAAAGKNVLKMQTGSITDQASSLEKDQPVLRVAKLIMVTANNNNKFYEMREQSDGTFKVTYGRVLSDRD